MGTGDDKSSLTGAAAPHLGLVIAGEESELYLARSSIFPRKGRSGFYTKAPNLRMGQKEKYCKG